MQTQLLLAALASPMQAVYYMCYCPAWDSKCPKQTRNIQSVEYQYEAESVVRNHLQTSGCHDELSHDEIEHYINVGHWFEEKKWKDCWGDMHEEFEKKRNKQGKQGKQGDEDEKQGGQDEEWQEHGDAWDDENDDKQWQEQDGQWGNDQQWQKWQPGKGQWGKQDSPYGKGGYGKGKGGQGKGKGAPSKWVSDGEQQLLKSHILALRPPPPPAPAPGSAPSSITQAPINAANPVYIRLDLKNIIEELSLTEESLNSSSHVAQAAMSNLQAQHLKVQTMRTMLEKRIRDNEK